jgi:hypothetical protein
MVKVAFVATLALMTSGVLSTPSFARSYSSCLRLAYSRGWTYSDLNSPGTRSQVRQFIRHCQQGRQH